MGVPSDHFLASIVIINPLMKRLLMITGQNASIFPKFVPTNVLQMRLSEGFSNTISKKNVLFNNYVACEFSFAGCKVKVKRKSMQKHLDESTSKHLKMTTSECKELRGELNDLKLALNKISPRPIFIPPTDIVMNEYERRRKEDEHWLSPAFYTHVGGYKMCLEIDADGWDDGKGTHVGVAVYVMKGELDSCLKWPFRGEITVELVNQKEGGVNCERNLVKLTDENMFQRVTEGERARSGWGYSQFISQADLYKPEKGKEYLLNDTLIFRVTKIVTSI